MNQPSFVIRDLSSCAPEMREQAAELLLAGFAGTGTESLSTIEGCRQTLVHLDVPGAIARVALDDSGALTGLIGGLPSYHGHAYELHPLVVHAAARGRGLARALVADLEREAAKRGATTLFLGADDEDNRTSIGGVDLYPDVLSKLAAIKNLRGHPFEFYRRVGFAVVGTLPDANGPGKPDIFMARRILAGTRTE